MKTSLEKKYKSYLNELIQTLAVIELDHDYAGLIFLGEITFNLMKSVGDKMQVNDSIPQTNQNSIKRKFPSDMLN